MSKTSQLEVTSLNLDLKNFRTVPQRKETDAIKAMISIKPDRFFAIMESIIQDGYLLTENIIILKDGDKHIVKEGNRRIAALKLIHNLYKIDEFGLPTTLINRIKNVDADWKKENLKVPCTIFNSNESDKANKLVNLAHGKGEKASRDPWNSVARARHNRDSKGASEPALDLLEKYLKSGQNLTNQQRERWGGDYPITVLHEAIRKIYSRFDVAAATDLPKKYPKIKYLSELETILRDIGLEQIGFEQIRNQASDFAVPYGLPAIITPTSTNASPNSNTSSSSSSQPSTNSNASGNSGNTTNKAGNSNNTTTPQATAAKPTPPQSPKAAASNDPKHVASVLKKFNPRGNDRQKVVALRDEIKRLKIKDNPIAFCFLLRSMFEISAKVYCAENSIPSSKNGQEKKLVDLLREATKHLTGNNSNKPMVKVLHGSMTEISKHDGILSVTSMNQLVHNTTFSVLPSDICTLFGNIYPLLEAMN
jgi:hypothetical protein